MESFVFFFYALIFAIGFYLVHSSLYYLRYGLLNKQKVELWKKIDKVGTPASVFFPESRAIINSLTNLRENTHKGYERFTKANRPFALPTMWTGEYVIVMPPSQLDIVNRPENEITGFWALIENIQLPYFIPDRTVIEKVIHFEVSRKDLSLRKVELQAASTMDEIDRAYRTYWGTESSWSTVNGWDTCGRIIARVALRTLVGSPMCRNGELLEQTRLFANSLFASAAVMNCMPPFLRPVLGPLLAIQARYYYGARVKNVLASLIEERIKLWEQHKNGNLAKDDLPVSSDRSNKTKRTSLANAVTLEDDFLQWLISRSASHGPTHMIPGTIALRLLALNTMFVFAMSYVFAHTVSDICTSPQKNEIVGALEEECRLVLASQNSTGLASKAAVDKLYRLDSTIRESMRVSDVGVVTLPRDVVGNQALDLGNGILAPPGTRLVFPTQSMHLDPEYHEDPLRFDPFRFSRPFENNDSSSLKSQDINRRLLVTLEPGFLAFGYGKRACPGRWFVAQMLKQALGYLVMHYDIEPVGSPPKRKALLNMMVPPTDMIFRVRRKLEK